MIIDVPTTRETTLVYFGRLLGTASDGVLSIFIMTQCHGDEWTRMAMAEKKRREELER